MWGISWLDEWLLASQVGCRSWRLRHHGPPKRWYPTTTLHGPATQKTTYCGGVSKSFRTGSLERELQMVQLSATRCSCIAILWISLVRFAAINLCVASQRMFIVVVYFVMDSVRKLMDTPSYTDWLCSDWHSSWASSVPRITWSTVFVLNPFWSNLMPLFTIVSLLLLVAKYWTRC